MGEPANLRSLRPRGSVIGSALDQKVPATAEEEDIDPASSKARSEARDRDGQLAGSATACTSKPTSGWWSRASSMTPGSMPARSKS
jgi:hypothetical protein